MPLSNEDAARQLSELAAQADCPELLEFVALIASDAETAEACLRLAKYDPAGACRLAKDVLTVQTAPTEAYIPDADRRWELFIRMRTHVRYSTNVAPAYVPVAVLAYFMVAPLPILERHVDSLRTSSCARTFWSRMTFMVDSFRVFLLQTGFLMAKNLWFRKHLPVPTGAAEPQIDPSLDEACRAVQERDGGVCLLTGASNAVATRILPYHGSADEAARCIYTLLGTFWPEEKREQWYALCRNSKVTESSPETMLSLSPPMAALWRAGRFALKPVPAAAASDNEVVAQFHWLKPTGYRSSWSPVAARHGKDEAVGRLCEGDASRWGSGEDWLPRASGLPLQTGQLFTIRADDATKLPSVALLELQWELVRIAAMCGAAGFPGDANCGDDEAEDDGNSAKEQGAGARGRLGLEVVGAHDRSAEQNQDHNGPRGENGESGVSAQQQ